MDVNCDTPFSFLPYIFEMYQNSVLQKFETLQNIFRQYEFNLTSLQKNNEMTS